MNPPSFADLQAELFVAVARHYGRLLDEHSVDQLYGYSLYTNDDVSSIGPVANTVNGIRSIPDQKDYQYHRYGPHEWSLWDDFGLFDRANALVRAIYADDSRTFQEKRLGMLTAAFQALSEQEGKGLFGPRTSDRYVVLWVVDSDEPLMAQSAASLNSVEVFHGYYSAYADEA